MFTSKAKLPAIIVGEAATKGTGSNQQSNCHKKHTAGMPPPPGKTRLSIVVKSKL
jgi:hypothetical protein